MINNIPIVIEAMDPETQRIHNLLKKSIQQMQEEKEKIKKLRVTYGNYLVNDKDYAKLNEERLEKTREQNEVKRKLTMTQSAQGLLRDLNEVKEELEVSQARIDSYAYEYRKRTGKNRIALDDENEYVINMVAKVKVVQLSFLEVKRRKAEKKT